MNFITITNTRIFFLVNAIHIMTMIVLQVLNILLIDIGNIPVTILSYVSQSFYLAILLYLVLAFRYFSTATAAIPLYIYFGVSLISIVIFSMLATKPEYFAYLSILNTISLLTCLVCAITALTARLQQLGATYSLYFFSVIFTQLIMIVAPMLVFEYVKVEPYNYFRYISFISVIPQVIIFFVLYSINSKLQQKQQQYFFDNINQ